MNEKRPLEGGFFLLQNPFGRATTRVYYFVSIIRIAGGFAVAPCTPSQPSFCKVSGIVSERHAITRVYSIFPKMFVQGGFPIAPLNPFGFDTQ